MPRTSVLVLAVLLSAAPVFAQPGKPIRVGAPMLLSGGGAAIGQAVLRGAEMVARELNERGGLLGRRVEVIVRDTRGTAEDAARLARELVAKDGAEFLVGGLRPVEVAALVAAAKELRIPYLVPASKAPFPAEVPKPAPYVFRTGTNATIEGRSAAAEMARLPVTRVFTLGPDDEYGQAVIRAFVDWLRKLKPEARLVGQAWPKPNDHDYPPFIATALGIRADSLFTALSGSQFSAFARQAKPLGLFDRLRVVAAADAGSSDVAMSLRDELPLGILANAYDCFYARPGGDHADYIERAKRWLNQEYPSSWVSTGYIAMQFLVEAVQRAGSTDPDRVSRVLEGLTIQSPVGKLTLRAKDHQATRGEFWGTTARIAEYPFPILQPARYVPADDLMD